MKYTKDNLHGLEIVHKDGNNIGKIIKLSEPTNIITYGICNYTTCNFRTGKSDTPWFTDEQAVEWLEKGIWIARKIPDEIINNYEIY